MRRTMADGGERCRSVGVFADDRKIRFCFAAFPHSLARHALIVDDHYIHQDPEGRGTLGGADRSRSVGIVISAVHSSLPLGPAVNDASAPNCTSRRSRTLFRPMPSGPAVRSFAVVLITRKMTDSRWICTSTRTSTIASWPASP